MVLRKHVIEQLLAILKKEYLSKEDMKSDIEQLIKELTVN